MVTSASCHRDGSWDSGWTGTSVPPPGSEEAELEDAGWETSDSGRWGSSEDDGDMEEDEGAEEDEDFEELEEGGGTLWEEDG
jgi:hypothetical protein